MPQPRRARASSHSEPHAAPSAALELDVKQLLRWAIGIARGVGNDSKWIRKRSAEEEELEGVATEALVELMHRFDEIRLAEGRDPTEFFRRTFGQDIRKRCQRHTEQLRNGGTYHTTDDKDVKERCRVRALPMCADCSDVSLPWPEREEDDAEEVPMPAGEPTIVWLVNGKPKEEPK